MKELLSRDAGRVKVMDAVTLHWELPAGGCFDYPRPKRAKAGNVLPEPGKIRARWGWGSTRSWSPGVTQIFQEIG